MAEVLPATEVAKARDSAPPTVFDWVNSTVVNYVETWLDSSHAKHEPNDVGMQETGSH